MSFKHRFKGTLIIDLCGKMGYYKITENNNNQIKSTKDITEEITMKNIKKIITSAIAGIMAAAALATTAGAAEYFNNDGSCWFDGTYDGKVYVEDAYGYYMDLDDGYTYYYDYYNYDYNNRKYDYNTYYNNNYNTYYAETFVGYDTYFGNVYYRADIGYYTSTRYLGSSFTFTEYVGKDQYGRKIYYRSEFGYIYLNGNTWYCLGYNANYVR